MREVVDKTGWPAGPWHHEPDQLEWVSGGLHCVVLRDPGMGFLCGYVGAPRAIDAPDDAFDVHGGVTFGGVVRNLARSGHYYVGFDCAHVDDYSPGREGRMFGGVYRDIDYVVNQCESLARQIRAVLRAKRAQPSPDGIRHSTAGESR